MANVLILGTGAWAKALANVLIINKHFIAMYGIDIKQIANLKNKFNNHKFIASNNMSSLFNKHKYDFVVLAVPSSCADQPILKIFKYLKNKPILINCVKGFDKKTCLPWTFALKKIISNYFSNIVSLYGPSFACEVMNKSTTFVNIVSLDKKSANKVINLFSNNFFICKYCSDEKFACYFSSFKNVIAIMMGLLTELKYSINTKAALFTISLNEFAKIIKLNKKNLYSLINYCGIGDLYLTCHDSQSRNFMYGSLLGKYGGKKSLLKNKTTVEGLMTLECIYKLMKSKKINLPLCENLYKTIYKNENQKKFVNNILYHLK